MPANTIRHINMTGHPGEQANLYVGVITMTTEHGDYSINHGLPCKRALTCLIKPEVGDTVLTCAQGSQDYTILHILQRANHSQNNILQLCPADTGKLIIQSRHISILGEKQLDITSLENLNLSACFGTLSILSRNLFRTVTDNLIENIRHHISTVGQYALTATHLLRLHGRQQIITADHDIKIDAERINMG